eukprot:906763_1
MSLHKSTNKAVSNTKRHLFSWFVIVVGVALASMNVVASLEQPGIRGAAYAINKELILQSDENFEPPTSIVDVQTSCPNKQVQIYKFWINGDNDDGSDGEHQLTLDGRNYFPNSSSDCKGYRKEDVYWCWWKEDKDHYIGDKAPWRNVDSHKSLTVGSEERDKSAIGGGKNDFHTAYLSPNEWFSDTCETYEVRVSVDFKEQTKRSVCKGIGAGIQHGGAHVESCSSWSNPAESYIWFMEVKPR